MRIRCFPAEFNTDELPFADGPQPRRALHDLGVRTGVADLRGLAAVLIQADKFGSSVAQALRVQSESMRTRRRRWPKRKPPRRP